MPQFPNDAVAIINSTAYSLSNRKPDRGYSVNKKFNGRIFTAISSHERRSSVSRRPKRIFQFTYTNVSGGYKKCIEDFYDTMLGEYSAFEFDLTYINLTGSTLARFDGELNISNVLDTGNEETSFYSVSFSLVETFS